jgi:ABC-type branched-subunit amino acid transport system substrate-binding protein
MDENSKPRDNKVKKVAKHSVHLLKYWVIFPLFAALIAALVIGRVTNWLLGPKSYKVYVVGSLDDEATKQIWERFSEQKSRLTSFGGIKVDVESVDDLGDPLNARRISVDLAERNDTLMIVGHHFSTQTKEALPAYLQQAQPPIPIILTTETNPNLLPPKITKGTYYPVFRLSPTDEKQAESAVQFAISQGATAFWVVEDISNPVYSSFLARKFIDQAQEKSKRVLLWSTNLNIPSVDAIRALKIDWVFYAGDWPNALILIRQLKAMSSNNRMPGIVLSDGSMDRRLINQGGDDVEGVFLTHPMTAKAYADVQYGIYGKDAFRLVESLLEEGDKRFGQLARKEGGTWYLAESILGIHRVVDARNVLFALMEEAVRTRHTFDLSDGTRCTFEDDGTRRDAIFHVWKVQNHQFVDIR